MTDLDKQEIQEFYLFQSHQQVIQQKLPKGYALVVFKPKPQQQKNVYDSQDFKLSLRQKKVSNYEKQYSDFVEKPTSLNNKYTENMRICYKILQIIKKHPFATPFLNKVDPIALNIPDYLDIVKEPIDLGIINNNLRNNNYTSHHSFIADMRKVWSNSFLYNPSTTEIYTMTSEISQYFEKMILENFDSTIKKSQNEQHISELSRKVERLQKELREINVKKSNSKSNYKMGNFRPLSFQEKRNLGQNIRKLPIEALRGVWDIVQENNGQAINDELEFDIDTLTPQKARKLEQYVKSKLVTNNKQVIKKKYSSNSNLNGHKSSLEDANNDYSKHDDLDKLSDLSDDSSDQKILQTNNKQQKQIVNKDAVSSESSFLTDSEESLS